MYVKKILCQCSHHGLLPFHIILLIFQGSNDKKIFLIINLTFNQFYHKVSIDSPGMIMQVIFIIECIYPIRYRNSIIFVLRLTNTTYIFPVASGDVVWLSNTSPRWLYTSSLMSFWLVFDFILFLSSTVE